MDEIATDAPVSESDASEIVGLKAAVAAKQKAPTPTCSGLVRLIAEVPNVNP